MMLVSASWLPLFNASETQQKPRERKTHEATQYASCHRVSGRAVDGRGRARDHGDQCLRGYLTRFRQAGRDNRYLTLTQRHDGTVGIKGLLDKEGGALALAVLSPFAAPAPATDGTPDPRDGGIEG